MVYAVSDRVLTGTPNRGAKGIARPRRRTHARVNIPQIHWLRVMALGLNVLIWVTIIAAIAHALGR